MTVAKSIDAYCQKTGIKVDYETAEDVTFIAPAGFVFSTEAITRHFEDYALMPARELRGYLDLMTTTELYRYV